METSVIKKETYVRNAKVVRVIDGDTAVFDVDLGCDIRITMSCRFAGINAPELSTPEGKQAKYYVQDTLLVGQPVVIETIKDKREKYGRYLAIVHPIGFENSLNDELIKLGHAVAVKY